MLYSGDEYYGDEITSGAYGTANYEAPYAAFRSHDGRVWVTRWRYGDKNVFTDEDDRTWRRITEIFYARGQRQAQAVYQEHLLI